MEEEEDEEMLTDSVVDDDDDDDDVLWLYSRDGFLESDDDSVLRKSTKEYGALPAEDGMPENECDTGARHIDDGVDRDNSL